MINVKRATASTRIQAILTNNESDREQERALIKRGNYSEERRKKEQARALKTGDISVTNNESEREQERALIKRGNYSENRRKKEQARALENRRCISDKQRESQNKKEP